MDIGGVKSPSWGGMREGAGRPSTGRKKHQYYVTDEEDIQIKQFIKQLRGQDMITPLAEKPTIPESKPKIKKQPQKV